MKKSNPLARRAVDSSFHPFNLLGAVHGLKTRQTFSSRKWFIAGHRLATSGSARHNVIFKLTGHRKKSW
jgi:hypothetical protein